MAITFTIITRPDGDKVTWEVRSYIENLMTPDRQVAKGVSDSEQAAQADAKRAWNKWVGAQNG